MIRDRALHTREKLVAKLPVTGELLRGSLLERTIRHKSGCPKCARGEGHQVYVLTVSYGGGRVRQFSVRRERVAEVRRWLDNPAGLALGCPVDQRVQNSEFCAGK